MHYIYCLHNYLGSTPISNAQYFGQGFGPVNIQSTACTGSELDILSCTYTSPSHCSHNDDSGVRCTGKYEMSILNALIFGFMANNKFQMNGLIIVCISSDRELHY